MTEDTFKNMIAMRLLEAFQMPGRLDDLKIGPAPNPGAPRLALTQAEVDAWNELAEAGNRAREHFIGAMRAAVGALKAEQGRVNRQAGRWWRDAEAARGIDPAAPSCIARDSDGFYIEFETEESDRD